jgi:hypothetical protein
MLSYENGRSRVLSRLVPSTTRASRWHQVDPSGKAKREVWRKLQSRGGEVLRIFVFVCAVFSWEVFLRFFFGSYWGADPTRSKLMQEVDQATWQCGTTLAPWWPGCWYVLLKVVVKVRIQIGLSFFWPTYQRSSCWPQLGNFQLRGLMILMSSVSVELSGRESSESSANCCEVMSIMWSLSWSLSCFLARLESSQRITWRRNLGMRLLWTIRNTEEEPSLNRISRIRGSNLFTSLLNVTLPWTICIDCIDISETSELLEPGSMVAVCSRCSGWEASEKKMPSNDNVRISEMLS